MFPLIFHVWFYQMFSIKFSFQGAILVLHSVTYRTQLFVKFFLKSNFTQV